MKKMLLMLAVLAGFAVSADAGRIGVVLEQKGGNVVITEVEPGLPASRAPLLPGDVIVMVDDQRVSSADIAGRLLRGAEGTVVHVTFDRNSERFTMLIVRASDTVSGGPTQSAANPPATQRHAAREPACDTKPGKGSYGRWFDFLKKETDAQKKGDKQAMRFWIEAQICELEATSEKTRTSGRFADPKWPSLSFNYSMGSALARSVDYLATDRDFETCVERAEAAIRYKRAGGFSISGGMLVNMGYCLGELGRTEEALDAAKNAIVLDPLNETAPGNAAWCLRKLNRPQQAEQFQERADALKRAGKYAPTATRDGWLRHMVQALRAEGRGDLARIASDELSGIVRQQQENAEFMAELDAMAAERKARSDAAINRAIGTLNGMAGGAPVRTNNPAYDEAMRQKRACEADPVCVASGGDHGSGSSQTGGTTVPGTTTDSGRILQESERQFELMKKQRCETKWKLYKTSECGQSCEKAADCMIWKGEYYYGGSNPMMCNQVHNPRTCGDPGFKACVDSRQALYDDWEKDCR